MSIRNKSKPRKSYIFTTKPEVVLDAGSSSPDRVKAKYTSTVSYLRPTEENQVSIEQKLFVKTRPQRL